MDNLFMMASRGKLWTGGQVFTLSSGSLGGTRGFSAESSSAQAETANALARALRGGWQVEAENAVLVSGLPFPIAIPEADTIQAGLSVEGVIDALQLASSSHKAIVLAGEVYFVKAALEAVDAKHVDLARIYLAVGGEFLPEAVRDRFMKLLGIEEQHLRGRIISSFGAAELGVALLFETPQTVQLRRWLRRHPQYIAPLLGEDLPTVPLFMAVNAGRAVVESVENKLLITRRSPGFQPERYRFATKDRGGFIDPGRLAECLKQEPELLQALPEKICWHYGRCGQSEVCAFGELLFGHDELAAKLTGGYALIGERVLEAQLRPTADSADFEAARLDVEARARSLLGRTFDVSFVPYREYQYAKMEPWATKFMRIVKDPNGSKR